jgi:chromosome partitioning protein
MPVIALISPKGGTGKTTTALLIACALAESGRDTVLIDADPNQPLVRWKARAGAIDGLAILAAADTARLANSIEAAGRVAPWIVIDTEGSSAREGAATSSAAIAAADLALIPLGPSAIEAHGAVKAVAHVRIAERRLCEKGAARAIPHAVVLTRMPAAIRPRTLRTMLLELTAQGVPILPAALVEKEAYRVMFALGWPLSRLTESHVSGLPAARANVDALLQAVLAWQARIAAGGAASNAAPEPASAAASPEPASGEPVP